MTHLAISLCPEADGFRVAWRLDGEKFGAGDPVAELPRSMVGAPTVALDGEAVAAVDDAGHLPLIVSDAESDEGEPVRRWSVLRSTVGAIEVSYLARPDYEEPRPATPPLELRREGGGLSGALKWFLVLPIIPESSTFQLHWEQPSGTRNGENWTTVCSLGEGFGDDGELAGNGLEVLGDTYLMCGDIAERHHRDGQMSTWWLTPPGFDVQAFTHQLGRTYAVMAEAFDAPAHPYRVFLRTHPHRGLNASAHPASFVMAANPDKPLEESKLYETVAHELVHEWLRLDGRDREISWFVEGSADYYSLVLPVRAGILDDDAFLRAVNLEARTCYANPRRHLTLAEAQRLFFSDFLAHWLPYTRGMFYLADLEARVRDATSGERSLDDVVRDVVRRRREGERIGLEEWCDRVDDVLPGNERDPLEALVFTGVGRPGPGTFGPRFEITEVEVPVLDIGFDPSTFITGRVCGLVPGEPADRAGLAEGDAIELPSYTEALALDVDDHLDVRITREGQTRLLSIPLSGHTTRVPQWHQPRDTA